MTAAILVGELATAAKALNEEIRTGLDRITVLEAHEMYTNLREIEGWLQGARQMLDPTGTV